MKLKQQPWWYHAGSRFDVTGEGSLDGNDLFEMEEKYESLMEDVYSRLWDTDDDPKA